MTICKFCQRIKDLQNDDKFDSNKAIAVYKLNGVITYYDEHNQAWFDDKNYKYHYLDQNNWISSFQICRTPRSQTVNHKVIKLDNGISYNVSLVRIENIKKFREKTISKAIFSIPEVLKNSSDESRSMTPFFMTKN